MYKRTRRILCANRRSTVSGTADIGIKGMRSSGDDRKNQIVLEKDPKKFAAGIYALYHNREYMRFLIHHGFENIENRFTIGKISETFLKEFAKGAER